MIFLSFLSYISYNLFFKYPILLKSHITSNDLRAELYADYSTFTFPFCLIDIRLWLSALSGELHDNVDVYINIKKGDKIIHKAKIVSNVDLISDYDFTVLLLKDHNITIIDKLSLFSAC